MFAQQKIKNRQNIDKEKSKILFPLPQPPFRNQEKKSTKFFAQSPPTRLSFPRPAHTHTHTDSFPTYPQPPLETLPTPLLRVFETCYKLNESL